MKQILDKKHVGPRRFCAVPSFDRNLYVYRVECADGSFYTGSIKNVTQRVKRHNNGTGAKYLKYKTPVRLVYFKAYIYYKNALKAERNLKKLNLSEKQVLIAAQNLNAGAPKIRVSKNLLVETL